MVSKWETQTTVGSAKALSVRDRIPLIERLEPEVKVHATVSTGVPGGTMKRDRSWLGETELHLRD